jgi:adenylate kinase family enzyme
LPPQVPKPNPLCVGCQTKDFTSRVDDTPAIIRHRLQQYRIYERDIIEYYRREGRLLQFTPYKGEKDVPRLCKTLERWMEQHSSVEQSGKESNCI